ncbi:MAG TPA: hypothetical protein ENK02_07015 [Planctomycetes bacterium]|nr:hypothetical protein [Planctomycetota bacterium]
MSSAAQRLWVLAGVLVFLLLVLLGKLLYLQGFQREVFVARRENRQLAWASLPDRRGAILDRWGSVLAQDEPGYELRIDYRKFRRGHALALLLHLDHLLRRLGEAGLVSGGALRYQDGDRRFAEAAGNLLDAPASLFSNKRSWGRNIAEVLRFYAFGLVHELFRPGEKFFQKRALLLLDFKRKALKKEGGTLLDYLSEETGLDPGEFRSRILPALGTWSGELDRLARLLGSSLNLPGSPGRSGGLRRYLDALDAYFGRRARRAQQRKGGGARSRAKGSSWFSRVFAREKGARAELAALIYKRFRIEDQAFLVAREVPLDPVVALVLGKQEQLPGFLIRESLRRVRAADLPWLGLVRERSSTGEAPQVLLAYEGGKLDEDPFDRDKINFSDPEWLEWKRLQRLRALRRRRVGVDGLERSLEPWLTGLPGKRRVVRDRFGKERNQRGLLREVPGQDVRLSLDLRLQGLAQEALQGALRGRKRTLPPSQRAALALLDARSGEILAMAWIPEKVGGRRDLKNTAAQIWHYALLGSTVKPLLAYEALLQEGLARGEGLAPCTGSWKPAGDRRIHCDGVHGSLQYPGVLPFSIAHSCNVYFAQVGDRLGLAGVARALARFGLWQLGTSYRSPPGLLVDPAGPVPRPRARGPHGAPKPTAGSFGSLYIPRSAARRAIGYGMEAPPLAVARAYAGLALGRLPGLRFLLRVGDRDLPGLPSKELGLDPQLLVQIQKGLAGAVGPGGTAFRSGVGRLGAVGKTGTAEISRRYNNAWFSGYFPAGEPRWAFSCVFFGVPHGVHGGDQPASTLRIFLEACRKDPVLRARYPFLGEPK